VSATEIWAMTAMDMKRLHTWDRRILRRTYGLVVEQTIWRIRSNQELRKPHKDLDIVADIKKEAFEWIGHLVRMDQGRAVKKIFESEPERSRRRGRP
jgi:hypothetical protein